MGGVVNILLITEGLVRIYKLLCASGDEKYPHCNIKRKEERKNEENNVCNYLIVYSLMLYMTIKIVVSVFYQMVILTKYYFICKQK